MSPIAINGVDKQGVYVNGVQVKQALDAASETVNKGVYDPTTLSAVDADLAVGNIKLATTIFGFLGTYDPAPTETFERYHVEAALAAGASYTPEDSGLFSTTLSTKGMIPELQDGGATWRGIIQDIKGVPAIAGNGTNLRFKNNDASARELVVMRQTISTGTYERYYTADVPAITDYIPSDGGFFSHACEESIQCYYQGPAFWTPWFLYNDTTLYGNSSAIGDGANMKYRNSDGANARWVVIMRAIMVT